MGTLTSGHPAYGVSARLALPILPSKHCPSASPSHRKAHCPNRWRLPRRPTFSCSAAAAGDDEPAEQPQGGSEGQRSSSVPDSLPLSGTDTDWREFRARLIRSQAASTSGRSAEEEQGSPEGSEALYWAHSIPQPETGCLLIAHPLMFTTSQQYFSQAVIFIFEHGEGGSAGLILNRPTQFTIGSIGGLEALCPEFADNSLYMGGDVSPNSMHMLHARAGLPGSVQVVRGIAMGGFDAAKAAIRDGRAPAQDFKWFTRYAGWGPGQLARECTSGVWLTAAASSALLLQQDPGVARTDSGRAMWHQVLELMGGEHAGLSREAKGLYDPRIMGAPDPSTDSSGSSSGEQAS